ncbi:RNA polymerase sigma factor [Sphingomonas colocasiae]|uniref:Sigma-70 family RNA polymerase sigma factor n=1 Tax=Sphingomonas colocasiae TaxID=1848973 RepID=A0ABS7PSH3_9SPHN|nr:sigma-70 family RNA polymerase sigma factor [Sphingomonas colocasiae]
MTGDAREPPDFPSVFIASRPALERMMAKYVGCPQVAADLAGDLYLRLARSDHARMPAHELQRYLFRAAINIAIDHARARRRRAVILRDNAVHFESVVESAEPAAIAAEQLTVVSEAIDELPDKLRDILRWRASGESYRDIAARLDVSVSMIEKHISRALQHCRQRLAQVNDIDALDAAKVENGATPGTKPEAGSARRSANRG